MYYLHHELAREYCLERLEQAHHERRGHQLARANRLTRRAEKAARKARLQLDRLM